MNMHSRFALHAASAISIVAAAAFGPPHLTVREAVRTNQSADPMFIIETRHHSDHGDLAMSGRAEGTQGGKRVSLPLRFVSTGAGAFTLAKQWQSGTPWVLVLAGEQGPKGAHGVAEALVKIDAAGKVLGIDYPAAGWVGTSEVPKRSSAKEIDSMLSSIPHT